MPAAAALTILVVTTLGPATPTRQPPVVPQALVEARILLGDDSSRSHQRRIVGRVRVRVGHHPRGDRAADLVVFGADEQLKADAAVPVAEVGDAVR